MQEDGDFYTPFIGYHFFLPEQLLQSSPWRCPCALSGPAEYSTALQALRISIIVSHHLLLVRQNISDPNWLTTDFSLAEYTVSWQLKGDGGSGPSTIEAAELWEQILDSKPDHDTF